MSQPIRSCGQKWVCVCASRSHLFVVQHCEGQVNIFCFMTLIERVQQIESDKSEINTPSTFAQLV